MIFRSFNCLKHFEIYVGAAIVCKNDWYVPGIKIICIYLRQFLWMEVSAPELKSLCKVWLRYTISPITDNPLQMGIRTWFVQNLQPGPGVCLWEDEDSKDYLISKLFQMAQGFFHICSSQGEGIDRN